MSKIFEYTTIKAESAGKFQSRGSKFLATLFPVGHRDDLALRLDISRKNHPKARHHCYAYRILDRDSMSEFASDDGEPSGSAGRPILSQLRSADLTNVGCIVVRYFGGTKLGVPGLIEAYGESAREAIGQAKFKHVVRTRSIRIIVPMALQPHLHRYTKQLDIHLYDENYNANNFLCALDLPLAKGDEIFLSLLSFLSKRDYPAIEDHLGFLGITIVDSVES